MTNAWKMRERIPSEGSNGKTADELALANLQNKDKGFQGTCHVCSKKGHKSAECRGPKKDKSDKTNFQGGRNKKHCDHCHHDGHVEADCFRKPGNPGYAEFKAKDRKKEASNVEIFLTNVESVTKEFIEPVQPIEVCLANMDRYADNTEYTPHEERCAHHDVSYDTGYKSHEERCANDVGYKSKRKADQEGGVNLSYVEVITHVSTTVHVEPVAVASMYDGVDKLIANPYLGKIQELSVQELGDEEFTLGSVPPSLCSRGSDSSSSYDTQLQHWS